MTAPTVLVDFSTIAYACWYSAEAAVQANAEYDVHAVYTANLYRKLSTILEAVGGVRDLIMAMDDHCSWRRDVLPGYKGNRPERYDPRPEGEAYLKQTRNLRWARSPGSEADDVIATLARQNQKVVIAAADKDLWVLWNPPLVTIYNPISGQWIDAEKIAKKFYGLEARYIPIAKALWGDSSDSIPNCMPRQQKQLIPLIKSCDGDWFKMLGGATSTSPRCREMLVQNTEQITRNLLVVQLRDNIQVEFDP